MHTPMHTQGQGARTCGRCPLPLILAVQNNNALLSLLQRRLPSACRCGARHGRCRLARRRRGRRLLLSLRRRQGAGELKPFGVSLRIPLLLQCQGGADVEMASRFKTHGTVQHSESNSCCSLPTPRAAPTHCCRTPAAPLPGARHP